MTRKELQAALERFPPDAEVMVLDGHNGGGVLRTINLGPTSRPVGEEDEGETADCEGRLGETVVVIGYGCY